MRDDEGRARRFAKELRRKLTDAEVILWSRIRPRECPDYKFRRQHPIGPYIADFACPLSRVVIEVDGDTHGADDEIVYDKKRDAFMQERGWTVIRVFNEDVYKRLEDTLAMIWQRMPPPSRRSRSRTPPP